MVVELDFIPIEEALEQDWLYDGGGSQCLLLISGCIFQANYEASRNQFYVYHGYPVLPMDERGWSVDILKASNNPSENYGITIDGVAPAKVAQ